MRKLLLNFAVWLNTWKTFRWIWVISNFIVLYMSTLVKPLHWRVMEVVQTPSWCHQLIGLNASYPGELMWDATGSWREDPLLWGKTTKLLHQELCLLVDTTLTFMSTGLLINCSKILNFKIWRKASAQQINNTWTLFNSISFFKCLGRQSLPMLMEFTSGVPHGSNSRSGCWRPWFSQDCGRMILSTRFKWLLTTTTGHPTTSRAQANSCIGINKARHILQAKNRTQDQDLPWMDLKQYTQPVFTKVMYALHFWIKMRLMSYHIRVTKTGF